MQTTRLRIGLGIGRVLRALGFRVVFPIGTLPIPYHPGIALVLLLAAPVWILWLGVSALAGASGTLRWWHPLIVAGVLAVPMSIPIVAWAMMVFRARLLQGVLIGGGVVLLAIDVAAGRIAPGWAAVPIAFISVYAAQRIGGLVLLARLRREAEAWSPIYSGATTIVIHGDGAPAYRARDLLRRCAIARIVAVQSPPQIGMTPTAHMLHWLPWPEIASLRAACAGTAPPGWSLPAGEEDPIVARPIDIVPPDGLTVTTTPYRAPFRLVTGPLTRLRAHGPGIDRARVSGLPLIVGPAPVFTAFHWTAIFGGRSEWQVGFARAAAASLGPEGNGSSLSASAFVARADRPEAAVDSDGVPSLIALIAAAAAAERAGIDAFWRAVAADPAALPDHAVLRRLRATPSLYRSGDGARLAAWLAAAKAARARLAAVHAAMLLEHLPDAEFAATRAEIRAVLNSRILAGEWRIGRDLDRSVVPRDCPRFGGVGGFGLIRQVPKLYDRLAALGRDEADLVERLRASI